MNLGAGRVLLICSGQLSRCLPHVKCGVQLRSIPDASPRRSCPCPFLAHTQGRGSSRTCRITAPGAVPRLFLRHYGLSRAAFAAGAVEALRFLAARVAEGADQRVYDMVDVLRAYQASAGAGEPAVAAR